MAQVYSFVDENGVTRLFAEIHPDPAGTPFNGGTITAALGVAPAAGHPNTPPLRITAASDQTAAADVDMLLIEGPGGSNLLLDLESNGSLTSTFDATQGGAFLILTAAGATRFAADSTGLGFFGKTPAAQPALASGTATPEQIALVLQLLGIASGT